MEPGLFFDALIIIVAGISSLPVAVLFLQSLSAYLGRNFPDVRNVRERPRVAVLVPAHDEGEGIGGTLLAIVPQLANGDRLVVVADNCTDGTAKVAADAGAEVIERQDALRRGKGYALDYGLRYIEQNPTEVVIIVDADCEVSVGSIDTLARLCYQRMRPVQALYRMHSPERARLKTCIAEFAWLLKNWVRPLGYSRLGLPCQLMGTGMAFPWALIEKAHLGHAGLVEDMQLGIDLALQGAPPLFCPKAEVVSYFPSQPEAEQSQRTRWEHGHLGMIVREVPRLLKAALLKKDIRLFAIALDLGIPPVSFLALWLVLATLLTAGGAAWGDLSAPFFFMTAIDTFFAVAIILAWLRFGREVLTWKELLSIPYYVLQKVPLYIAFVFDRQREWIRTGRN